MVIRYLKYLPEHTNLFSNGASKAFCFYYKGELTLSALEHITVIDQTQLGHYAAGQSVPRKRQVEKIELSLHHLGDELQSISF